jgi:hypothetical protein
MSASAASDESWDDPAREPFVFPKGPEDGPEVIERYGPGEGEVILWDTTSNYARIRALRLEGKTVPEISAALSLPPSTVKQSLTNQIKMESAKLDGDEINSILGLEMERLDHMLQSHWWAAKAGDVDSTKIVLAIGKERREWLKWAQPEPTHEVGVTNNILVVGGTEAEFLAQLETARVRLEAEHGTITVEAEEVDGRPDDAK